MAANPTLQLPQPGSIGYLKSLSEMVAHRAYPAPFDELLFTSLFFCLVAKDKHLMIRTRDEDVVPVQRLTKSILTTVFGFSTVVMRLKAESTPEELLENLFLNSPHSPLAGRTIAATRSRSRHGKPSLTIPRTPSYHRDSFTDRNSPATSEQPRYRLSVAATAHSEDDLSVRGIRPRSGRGFPVFDSEQGATPGSAGVDGRQRAHLPHALVLCGLDVASEAVQETLWEVLRTRTVVMEDSEGNPGEMWNLPDGFILVGVGSLGDGRERPPMMKALLDRFSFNTNFVYRDELSASGVLSQRAPLLDHDYLDQLQAQAQSVAISDQLAIHMSNMITATRHHPQFDSSLITSRATKDLKDFVKTSCALTGAEGDPVGKKRGQLSATDVDAKRVVRQVLGHRVGIRKTRQDEVLGSLVMGRIDSKKDTAETRRTIKDVMDEIVIAVG